MTKPFIANVSRFDINTGMHYDAGPNAALIQIIDEREHFPVPKHSFKDVHQFIFDDVFDPDHPESITDLQASRIANILVDSLAKEQNVIVHCHAGIFRSGAVVEAGVRLGFNPPDTFRCPNPNVLKRLLECLDLPVEPSIRLEIAMAKGAY